MRGDGAHTLCIELRSRGHTGSVHAAFLHDGASLKVLLVQRVDSVASRMSSLGELLILRCRNSRWSHFRQADQQIATCLFLAELSFLLDKLFLLSSSFVDNSGFLRVYERGLRDILGAGHSELGPADFDAEKAVVEHQVKESAHNHTEHADGKRNFCFQTDGDFRARARLSVMLPAVSQPLWHSTAVVHLIAGPPLGVEQ